MSHQIDVFYDDGSIDCFPETAFSGLFGASALDNIRFRFDADIASEGLVAELRHFEAARPGEDDFAYESDPRGYPCQGRADAWPVLVSPDEARHVLSIHYNGIMVISRIGTHLINIAHVNHLASLYFNEAESFSTYMKVAALFHYYEDKRRRTIADSIYDPLGEEAERELIASQIGVSLDLLNEALDYEAFSEMVGDEGDGGNGTPNPQQASIAAAYESLYGQDDEEDPL